MSSLSLAAPAPPRCPPAFTREGVRSRRAPARARVMPLMSRTPLAIGIWLLFASTACSLETSVIVPASATDGAIDGAIDGGGDTALPDGATADSTPTPDGGRVDSGAPCVPGETTCSEGIESICEASGALRTRTCGLGCAATAPRCALFIPSNVDLALLDPTAPDVLLSGEAPFDTEVCGGSTFPQTVIVTQVRGTEVCVAQTGALTVDLGARLTIVGARPLVVLSAGPVVIAGDIDVSAYGRTAGAGGALGSTANGDPGAGSNPGGEGATNGSFEDGAGGGGGQCGAGGPGGTGGDADGGAGGGVVEAAWELSPLRGGSGGGAGRSDSGHGGAGGGALQISSPVSITVEGQIFAGGGGGGGGQSGGRYGAGGGGGSGGAVLLEATTVTVGSTAGINASGGGGGGSASGSSDDGTAGQDGALNWNGGERGGRAGSTFGSHGGRGGGGATPDGSSGGSNSGTGANGGGGGGGAGCVLFRTADGVMPATAAAFSPTMGLGLRTLEVRRE